MSGEPKTTETPSTIDPGVAEHFRIFAEEYDGSTEWCGDSALLSLLLEGADGTQALDLGCGTGLVAQELQKNSGQVLGLDLSYPMLVRARSRIGSRVLQGEAESLPFRSASLALVVCRQVLHYTREAEVLCEVARILRPGGEFRLAQITSRDERDFLFWTVFKTVSQPLRRRCYSPSLLHSIVESCCFEVREMKQYQVRRHYSRETLFRRSPLPETKQERFLDWMRESLRRLEELLEPEWNAGGLTILQPWTVLFCVRRS